MKNIIIPGILLGTLLLFGSCLGASAQTYKPSASERQEAIDAARAEGPLWLAIAEDDVKRAAHLLNAGADVNGHKDANGQDIFTTPLLRTLGPDSGGIDLAMVRLLLTRGAKPNVRFERGDFPLKLAIQAHSLDAVRLLIEKGADVNSVVDESGSILNFAVYNGQLDTVRMLLAAGAKIDLRYRGEEGPEKQDINSLLDQAVAARSNPIALFFLNKGADPNHDNGAPLEFAAQTSNETMLQLLLSHGAKVAVHDRKATMGTLLGLVIRTGNPSPGAVKELLAAGADPNAHRETEKLFASLSTDVNNDSIAVTILLLRAGEILDARVEGREFLARGLESGNKSFVQMLLNKGVSANDPLPSATGVYSSLRMIAEFGQFNVQEGATVALGGTIPDTSPAILTKAAAENDADIAALLIQCGANVNDGVNRFALLDAAESGNIPLVQLLLSHNAPVNVNERDYTAFRVAEASRNDQVPVQQPGPSPNSPQPAETAGDEDKSGKSTSTAPEEVPLSTPDFAYQYAGMYELFGPDSLRRTPLLAAAMGGHLEIVRMLLARGADAQVRNRWGQTPLIATANFGRSALIRYLPVTRSESAQEIENHALQVKRGMLRDQDDKPFQALLQQGWRLDWPISKAKLVTKELWAVDGDTAIIEQLLAAGADVNAVDDTGESALHYTVRLGLPRVALALLKAGANINLVDKTGRTPLIALVRDGRRKWVTDHTDSQAAAEIKRIEGFLQPDKYWVDQLRTWRKYHQAKLAAPLAAAASDDVAMAELMLRSGANPALKDKSGLSAADWAKKLDYPQMAAALRQPPSSAH